MTAPDASIRVLVVEDEPVAAQAHSAYVERVPGFVVSAVVGTAREALGHLAEHQVELVLLDMGLPDLPGLSVIRAMRARGLDTDVMAVTSMRDLHSVRAAVSLGVVQYVLKPFVFATLQERLVAYASYREQVLAGDQADTQAHVDSMLAQLRRGEVPTAPKGITDDLLGAVANTLRESGSPLTAAELGDATGVSRVTARRYAEHLVDSARAVRGHRYPGVGRSEVTYRWV